MIETVIEDIQPLLPRVAQFRGRPHAWNFLTRDWVDISALNIREGEWGPQPYLGDKPLPVGVVLAMGISSRTEFGKGSAEPEEEDEPKKPRRKFTEKQVRETAAQLAKQHGGEVKDFLPQACRIFMDADLIERGYALVETYPYVTADGKVTLYLVDRYEHERIRGAKQFPTRYIDKSGMLRSGTGGLKVPYRFHTFAAEGEIIYVEGEKDADRLATAGIIATTMAGQHWSAEGALAFKGRDVIIIGDKDDSGRENVAEALRCLAGIARSIKVVKLPGLKRTEDVTDWLDAHGHTIEELKTVIEATPASGIKATPRIRLDNKTIPLRDWVSKPHYIRKFGSMVVATGAAGKSSLVIAEALALASGKSLLSIKPARGEKYNIWYICGEDGIDELDRRFTAAMMHYGIETKDIEGHLFYDSGRTMPVVLAELEGNRLKLRINEDVMDQIGETIMANKIDVLVLDPLVNFHRVRENVNEDMEPIIKRLNALAEECNISYALVHHTRKPNGNGMTVDDARGASSAVNAARTVRVINSMTPKEAELAGIAPHKRGFYFSSYNGKQNLAPPSEARDWYELKSVDLQNGDGFEVEADHIGVVTSYNYPAVELPADSPGDIALALDKIRAGGPWRRAVQSKTAWIGIPIAEALNINLSNPLQKKALTKRLNDWLSKGILKVVIRKDESRKDREFVEVGDEAGNLGREAVGN